MPLAGTISSATTRTTKQGIFTADGTNSRPIHPSWQSVTPSAIRREVARRGGSSRAARSHIRTSDVRMMQ